MTDDRVIPGAGPDPDVAAAELALGLLEGEDRAAALRRTLSDPGFAREVDQWRAHFGGLFADVRPVNPRADHGERVIARLDGRAVPKPRLWQGLALASSLAAAGLLAFVITQPTPGVAPTQVAAAPAPMVAAFMVEGSQAPIVATLDAAGDRLSMPGPMPVPQGKDAQLWAIGADGVPRPLGLFHRAGDRVEAAAPAARNMTPGITFAISIEPAGGSPTGAPTGPVVASAKLVRA